MNSDRPSRAYSSIRSATSVWLPTSAVPAPPRSRPTPAHRLGGALGVAGEPAVQLAHPARALGLAVREPLLHLAYHRLVDAFDQPPGLPPGLVGGVPADDVQPGAGAPLASRLAGQAV